MFRALAVVLLFLADRLTKYWALHVLKAQYSLPVLPFFHLTYIENTGAAFGVGNGKNLNFFFIVLTSILTGFLFYMHKAWARKNAWVAVGLVLVTAGALGNLYDRVFYGYVVDFLDFRVWPVFNLADSCVTVGAACLAWGLRGE
ncbi:MAG: signal peptidase II [Elusimicrobia bacterium]|nr:signal peptidase II [Elusimicrobiota bacterium]